MDAVQDVVQVKDAVQLTDAVQNAIGLPKQGSAGSGASEQQSPAAPGEAARHGGPDQGGRAAEAVAASSTHGATAH